MEAQSNTEISTPVTSSQKAEQNFDINSSSIPVKSSSSSSGSKTTKSTTKNKNNFKSNGQNRSKGNHGESRRHYDTYGLEHDAPLYGLDRPTQKKTNLNHLLNFTFKSRDPMENYYEYEKTTRNFFSTKLSKSSVFSKEQFLQANCQFVVKDGGDYTIHMVDPDRLVDWSKIEEIHIETLEPISCPICLYEPTCGKMTKCGHIYCWSCILHYLSLSDKAWRKCPICYESIYKADLKSVQIKKHEKEFKIGDEIKMNLMFRFKNKYNTLTLPFSLYETFVRDEKLRKSISFDLFDSAHYSEFKQYFKFHSKTPSEIYESVLKRERVELEKQTRDEMNQPEVCFVNEALNLLCEREESLIIEIEKEKKIRKKSDDSKHEVKIQNIPSQSFTDAFENLILDKTEPMNDNKNEEKEPKTNIDENSLKEESKNVNLNDLSFFFQSSDGQRIYINGLNNRCLMAEYTSFNKCPLTLNAKILAIESIFMTEENRKRHKYLSHLPLHTEFKLIELELKPPILSQKTLDLFKGEIEDRAKMRKRIENRDKREAERIAALSETTPHYYVQSAMDEPVVYIKSVTTEPVLDYEIEFPEASSSPPVSSGASVSEVSTGSSVGGVPNKSFAQMLRVKNTEQKESPVSTVGPNNWPSLESSASASSSNQLTGWVTMAKQQTQQQSMLGRAKRYQNPPSPWGAQSKLLEKNEPVVKDEDSEEMPAPLYKQSFFSAIDESLKQFELKKCLEASEESTMLEGASVQDKTKKKKKTKKLLFSTSGF
ncbi:unnamed protein product [Brachionus calyciflorus]|uniref:E3 ubiquitin-protein ligase RNF10 n=1 Tax=Brachionus calyciflorus TaxID=104777 RepID=A0A813M1V3_9BILA|nr:unnamed protein product [Brachionus calyciflorus]